MTGGDRYKASIGKSSLDEEAKTRIIDDNKPDDDEIEDFCIRKKPMAYDEQSDIIGMVEKGEIIGKFGVNSTSNTGAQNGPGGHNNDYPKKKNNYQKNQKHHHGNFASGWDNQNNTNQNKANSRDGRSHSKDKYTTGGNHDRNNRGENFGGGVNSHNKNSASSFNKQYQVQSPRHPLAGFGGSPNANNNNKGSANKFVSGGIGGNGNNSMSNSIECVSNVSDTTPRDANGINNIGGSGSVNKNLYNKNTNHYQQQGHSNYSNHNNNHQDDKKLFNKHQKYFFENK